MDFLFSFTDSGRSDQHQGEALDCTVRAVAELFSLSYSVAHAGLAKAGRRFGRRFYLERRYQNIPHYGERMRYEKLDRKIKIADFIKEMGLDRTYIVHIRGHVFCVNSGVIYDTEVSSKFITSRKNVIGYYYPVW